MNIFIWIMVIFGGLAGVAAGLYLTFSIPVIVVWKIYRKVKFKMSLYD